MASKARVAGTDNQEPDGNDNEAAHKPGPTSFESLPLVASSRGVASYAASQSFSRLTPVQAATIPLLLKQDAAVQAVTGSGKTLAFLIPVVEHVLLRCHNERPLSPSSSMQRRRPMRTQVHSIVLSPTRELAQQTFAVAHELFRACSTTYPNPDVCLPPPLLLTGSGGTTASSSSSSVLSSAGTTKKSIRPVMTDLKTFQLEGNDVLVGTPGRVNDFLSYQTVVDCSELEYFILDEADVMFENGSLAGTLSSILSRLPKQKRVGLFSATTNSASLQEWMVRVGMRNPVWVDVSVVANRVDGTSGESGHGLVTNRGEAKSKQRTPTTLCNYYITTRIEEKFSRLVAFLQDHRSEKMIVFFLTCACVEFFGGALQHVVGEEGPLIELLHGRLVQRRREKTLERFHSRRDGSRGCVLACTDVAARGLDVADVDWVVQLDAPQDPAVFVHRVGRTARAGKEGKSLLFLTPKEEAYIELLHMRQVPIVPLPYTERCCPPSCLSEDEPHMTKSKNCALRSSISNESLTDVLPLLRDLALKDRDFLERGTKAFTSYIRAYKEHRCAFIFRFQALDLGLLATSFALLRLPKMPELRDRLVQRRKTRKGGGSAQWYLPNFDAAGPEVDIFAIPYLDPHREAARQKRLRESPNRGHLPRVRGVETGHVGKTKRSTGHEQSSRKGTDKVDKLKNEKKRSRHAKILEEWDDLAKEERLYKKFRKKKISQAQLDRELYSEDEEI